MKLERVGYVACLMALFVAFAVPAGAAQEQRPVEACMEDVVLVGAGDFTPDGYWEWYECGPALDDFGTYETGLVPALTPPPTDTSP